MQVFPHNLSSRQYRMAIKTLIRITSPPSLISQTQPVLSSILLELVLHRVRSASPERLDKTSLSTPTTGNAAAEPALSEQSVYIMSMIDALPLLPVDALEEWLPIVADTLKEVPDENMLHHCRQRFWEILSNGEMDVSQAARCVDWWSTKGGREKVLYGEAEGKGPFMSGALGETSKL